MHSRPVVSFVLTASLLLAACGSGGSTPAASPQTSAAPQPAATQPATSQAPSPAASPTAVPTAAAQPTSAATAPAAATGVPTAAAGPTQPPLSQASSTAGPQYPTTEAAATASLLAASDLPKSLSPSKVDTASTSPVAQEDFAKNQGKRIVARIWRESKATKNDVYAVADFRFQFETPQQAADFLTAAESGLSESGTSGLKLSKNTAPVGEHGKLYTGTTKTTSGEQLYLWNFMFTTGNIMAKVFVFTRTNKAQPAVDIAQAAVKKVEQATGAVSSSGEQANADSPLAIPRATLEGMGMKVTYGGQSKDIKTLLEKHRGKQLFSNDWGKGEKTGITNLLDTRFEFGSANDAQAFIKETMQKLVANTSAPDVKWVETTSSAPTLGDVTVTYRATSTSDAGTFYAYGFSSGRTVAVVLVAAGTGTTDADALALAQAASAQVKQASR